MPAAITPGSSQEARQIEKFTDRARRCVQKSSIVLGWESNVEGDLDSLADECKEAAWDGNQALPVRLETLRLALRFVGALPLEIPAPSVGVEPDGHLTLEWHRAKRRVLSISFSPDGDLHYAALLGSNKAYGTEAFFGEVPKAILDLIRRVYEA